MWQAPSMLFLIKKNEEMTNLYTFKLIKNFNRTKNNNIKDSNVTNKLNKIKYLNRTKK